MGANRNNPSMLIDDMCVVRILSGYTIVTTDNPQAVVNLFEKIKHRLNVTVDILPVVASDSEIIGCGKYCLGVVPNTYDDNWESGFVTAWFPTKDDDTYVTVNMTVQPDQGVLSLVWVGLVFIAANAKIDTRALPAFGLMTLHESQEGAQE